MIIYFVSIAIFEKGNLKGFEAYRRLFIDFIANISPLSCLSP